MAAEVYRERGAWAPFGSLVACLARLGDSRHYCDSCGVSPAHTAAGRAGRHGLAEEPSRTENQKPGRPPRPRRRGSNISRTASPARLKASTERVIAMPTQNAKSGADTPSC